MEMFFDSLKSLDAWLEKNGWQGYDPYDIRGTRFFIFSQKVKYAGSGLNFLLDRNPMLLRRIFRIRKQINAKAMALFARAYLNLYKKTLEERYLRKASALFLAGQIHI